MTARMLTLAIGLALLGWADYPVESQSRKRGEPNEFSTIGPGRRVGTAEVTSIKETNVTHVVVPNMDLQRTPSSYLVLSVEMIVPGMTAVRQNVVVLRFRSESAKRRFLPNAELDLGCGSWDHYETYLLSGTVSASKTGGRFIEDAAFAIETSHYELNPPGFSGDGFV